MSITIDYPQDGEDVFGNGAFFAWGIHGSPVMGIVGAFASWNGGAQSVGGTFVEAPAGCNWAFRFSNVIADGTTNVTLTVVGIRPNPAGPMHPPLQVLESTTFECNGHARHKGKKPEKKKQENERREKTP